MVESLTFRNLAWAITTCCELVLLYYLFKRKLFRAHPAFCLYILAAVLQSAILAYVYHFTHLRDIVVWAIAWSCQAVIIAARWLAVAEISRRIFADYSGIWKITKGVLMLVGVFVLAFALAASGRQLKLVVLNADRAVELFTAAFIVAIFLFARYYRLPVANLERYLATGFCLYSCFYVINDSVYENWHDSLGSLWSFLDVLTFLASLLLWISAVRRANELQKVPVASPIPSEKYRELSLEVNSRLQLLNNRLNQLLRSEDSRS